MISVFVTALGEHLWQSTLVAVAAGCLTLLVRRSAARIRYVLWLTASAKFLIPFSVLSGLGALIPWLHDYSRAIPASHLAQAGQLLENLMHWGPTGSTAAPLIAPALLATCGAVWALGTCFIAIRWHTRWRRVVYALRESTPINLPFTIPVRSSSLMLEPVVVGVLRPVLLLPHGLRRTLNGPELRAVMAHERCHVLWKDNAAAALHMLVEAIFWFHPFVWWLGARMVDERERACDERVLGEGHLPASYAEGILKVCEHYLGSQLECVAGIGGAELQTRIEGILGSAPIEKTGRTQRLILVIAACLAFGVPVAAGAFASPIGPDRPYSAPTKKSASKIYLGPPRDWELRSEVWLGMPDPATQGSRR